MQAAFSAIWPPWQRAWAVRWRCGSADTQRPACACRQCAYGAASAPGLTGQPPPPLPALQDGLEAPPAPEEWPARGSLDDDDLPIEALMDVEDDDDEDLSLAALLRRQLLGEPTAAAAAAGASSSTQVRRAGRARC